MPRGVNVPKGALAVLGQGVEEGGGGRRIRCAHLGSSPGAKPASITPLGPRYNRTTMSQTVASSTPRRRRPSLFVMLLTSLGLGILCGLFFGESCAWLKTLGDAFIDLLQMSVLPYVTFSLITKIGRLTPANARRLAGRAGLVLLVLWGIGALVLVAAGTSFPTQSSGSFFSTRFLQPPPEVDLVKQYIPANPFNSLANNVVPAVVLFSILFGVALISIDGKEKLLDQLDVACDALTRINGYIVRLTPYGVFAIVSAVAGTMTIDELGRLQGYLMVYTAASALLVFVVLPMLVSAVTPFTYSQVVGASRDAVLTAFATGKLFVVLPMLVEASQKLLDEVETVDEKNRTSPGVLIPLAYPFPSIGKMLGLLFLPFAAWYSGDMLELAQYPLLLGAGLLTFFGSPVIAVPYLLDLFRLPADMFDLFVVSGIYCARLGDAVGTVHLMAFTLLTSCSATGHLQIRVAPLVRLVAVSVVLVSVGLGFGPMILDTGIDRSMTSTTALDQMDFRLDHPTPVIRDRPEANPEPLLPEENQLDRIQRTGTLRVGYTRGTPPFAFLNRDGRLVGFDVEMAHILADDLNADLVLVPFARSTLVEQLEEDHFDIAMSGLVGATSNLAGVRVVDSTIDLTFALVVPDHLRDEFADLESIRSQEIARLGFVGSQRLARALLRVIPNAKLETVDSPRDFFEGELPHLDGMILSAESGFAWTLRYPHFQVVIPEKVQIRSPLVYPVRGHDESWHKFLESWFVVNSDVGTTQRLYEHWILGEGASAPTRRWSIMRDVLHWAGESD